MEDGNYGRRMHFCNWFLRPVRDGVLGPKLAFFTDEAWFHLSALFVVCNLFNDDFSS
jgi:hypothetical protein